uniref:Uncharacterized protein n=1 Tax=mine drainage metagenome TaxID=410659 RepID=E6PYM5_9ZZZZ
MLDPWRDVRVVRAVDFLNLFG